MSDTEHPHQLRRIIAAVADDLWAILPAKLDAILSLLDVRATGQRLSEQEIRAALATRSAAPPTRTAARGVGLLPVWGVLGQRMNLPLQMSGGTSTEQLAADFRQLHADDAVGAIVLAIDSPGGSCYGIDELATEIRASRGSKPIIACVSSLCASAAYWLASQADRIVCTPGGDVGSIGVITAHEDVSAAQERVGVRTTLITAGKHKGEGHPFAPLSDEARAHLQRRVDECYARFVGAVAAGRNVSEATVRSGYGQGRLLGARDALAAGLVDEVRSLDDVIGELATRTPTRSQMSARGHMAGAAGSGHPSGASLDDWHRNVALGLRLLDL